MKLIALTGLPRTGKDTFANRLASNHGYVRMAFADPLKAAAAVLLNRPLGECHGLNGYDRESIMPEWGFSMRWFLQRFGTECMRNQIDPDFWIKRMALELDKQKGRSSGEPFVGIEPPEELKVVITDCRFENEAKMIRERGGMIVEIRRKGVNRKGDHVSDDGVTLTNDDLVVPNHGSLAELYSLIDNLAACYDW